MVNLHNPSERASGLFARITRSAASALRGLDDKNLSNYSRQLGWAAGSLAN